MKINTCNFEGKEMLEIKLDTTEFVLTYKEAEDLLKMLYGYVVFGYLLDEVKTGLSNN